MNFDEVIDSLSDSFVELAGRAADYVPKILGAFAVLIVGLIVAKILSTLVGKLFEWIEGNKWYKKLLKQANLKVSVAEILKKLSYWVVLLIFISTAVSVLGLVVLTDTFNAVIGYVPTVVAAALVLGVSIWGGRVLQDIVVTALNQSKIEKKYRYAIGVLVYVAVLVFGATIAMSQLGFDTLIITTNVSIVMAGFALAAALAFGLGGKAIASSVIASMYVKSHVKKGQKIVVGDVQGTVKEISAAAVTVSTSDGDVVVPFSRIMS